MNNNLIRFFKNLQYDRGVRSPYCCPQSNIHQSNFGNANLSTLRILVRIRAQRGDVHLLGLFAHSFFVFKDGLNDKVIAESDESQWNAVEEEEEAEAKSLGLD